MPIPDTDTGAWLALWRVPGIGPARFRDLTMALGGPSAVLAADRSALRALGIAEDLARAIAAATPQAAEADLRWLEAPEHHLLRIDDPGYPGRLRALPDAPPLLFVHGDPSLLADPQIALVGSRNPSPGGAETAADFAEALARAGLIVTSGLALGVDAAAHRGALRAGAPTLAVAGTGIDRIYPARHRDLAHEIVERGALVSEFPVGTEARREHFPRRNRIISGLSLGTLVVEAARQSGSLITARLAGEQGREVFAVPGSIHNPMARGCHRLIREGAKLVETAADVLEELRGVLPDALAAAPDRPQEDAQSAGPQALDGEYAALLDCVGYEPTSIDRLVERSGLTPDAVSSMLLILELKDLVAAVNGGYYVRCPPSETHERDRA
jgi:DNA processing protein